MWTICPGISCMEIGKRFAEESVYDVVASFHSVKHRTTVSAYIDRIEEVMALVQRDTPYLPEDYYIRSFIAGLKDYIQSHSHLQNLVTLIDAYWVAKRLKQSNPFKKVEPSAFKGSFKSNPNWFSNKSGTTYKANGLEQKGVSNKNVAATNAPRNDGKCFRCNEKWYPDHKQDCKMNRQVRAMVTREEEEEEEGGAPEENSQESNQMEEEAQEEGEYPFQLSVHAV